MSEKELGASLRDADFIAALDEVERAYDPEIFSPLSDDDIRKLVKAMGHNTDVRAPSDRLHAHWGRHIAAVIRRRAEHFRAERSDAPTTPSTRTQESVGAASDDAERPGRCCACGATAAQFYPYMEEYGCADCVIESLEAEITDLQDELRRAKPDASTPLRLRASADD